MMKHTKRGRGKAHKIKNLTVRRDVTGVGIAWDGREKKVGRVTASVMLFCISFPGFAVYMVTRVVRIFSWKELA